MKIASNPIRPSSSTSPAELYPGATTLTGFPAASFSLARLCRMIRSLFGMSRGTSKLERRVPAGASAGSEDARRRVFEQPEKIEILR